MPDRRGLSSGNRHTDSAAILLDADHSMSLYTPRIFSPVLTDSSDVLIDSHNNIVAKYLARQQ